MMPSDKQLTLRIAALKEAIRRKYRMFKDGTIETEKRLEKQYKPIIQEIRKTAPNIPDIKTEQETVKEEPMDYDTTDDEGDEEFAPSEVSTPISQLRDVVSTPSGRETASRYIEQQFENPLTQKYMKLLMQDTGGSARTIDHDFGPRYDEHGRTLMIGDKVLDFDTDGTILINKTRYRPTEGLYELLFKRLPDDEKYTDDDLRTYKSILVATNAHKKGYNFHNQIRRDKSVKYRHVIKELFPVKLGKGMAWKSVKSRDLVHWDDPNELVSRLKVLVMSTESGNTSHRNEMLNIIEELREAGYIKGAGNSRFKSLLR